MTDRAALLDLIAGHAPKLRAAGVLHVELEGLAFSLAPAEPEPAAERATGDDAEAELGVLNDPATFGRRTGVPGRGTRERGRGP